MKITRKVGAVFAFAALCSTAPADAATYNLGFISNTGITSFSSDPLDPATGSFTDLVKFRYTNPNATIENLALTVSPGSTISNFTVALYTAGGTFVNGQLNSTFLFPPSTSEAVNNLQAGSYTAVVMGNISAPASYDGSLFLSFGPAVPIVLGTPGPIAGAGLVPLLGLAGAYLFGRRRLTA